MQAELLRLVGASGGWRVFVTHSVDEALVLGDRIILLSPRPGRIIADMAVPFALGGRIRMTTPIIPPYGAGCGRGCVRRC